MLLLAASLGVGAIGWFLLGESETLNAAEPAAASANRSASAAEADENKVVARAAGQEILAEEVYDSIAGQLIQKDRERHELIQNATINLIRDRLIDAEANKRGMDREELMAAEVEAKVSTVEASAVDAFYNARRAQIRAPKDRVEGQIRQHLALSAFIEELEASYSHEVMLDPFRVEVAAEGPSKGPADAPVTIVEFSDFQCPYCSRVNPAVKQVMSTYGDKVQLVFRQYPLPIHPEAPKAGEASLCAADQDKFWELHDAMFADQKNLGVASLKSKAAAIEGIDAEAFNTCLDSSRHADTVAKDLAEGGKAGVGGTPAFFINGRFINGAADFETFASIIDEELARQGT